MERIEYDKYAEKVKSEEISQILLSDNATDVSKLAAEMSIIYARVSLELGKAKDIIATTQMSLTDTGMAVNKAELQAESTYNKDRDVSRRDLEYLLKAVDKLGYVASMRASVILKDKIKEFGTEEHGF